MIINLLEETEKALKNHRVSVWNIKYIRNSEGYIPVADFITAAQNFNYDNEKGEVEVDLSLSIVGKFWWLSREYRGGKEGWVFHKKPQKPALQAPDFLIKNTRPTKHSTFDDIVEK